MSPRRVGINIAKGDRLSAVATTYNIKGKAMKKAMTALGCVLEPAAQWKNHYPDGIPPRDSDQYREVICKALSMPDGFDVQSINEWPRFLQPVVCECDACVVRESERNLYYHSTPTASDAKS